jgi:hypothetical protein
MGWGWLKRINRSQYWVLLPLVVAINIGVALLIGRGIGEWIYLIVCVPRLHDIGRSAWWFAVWVLLEVVAGALAALSVVPVDLDFYCTGPFRNWTAHLAWISVRSTHGQSIRRAAPAGTSELAAGESDREDHGLFRLSAVAVCLGNL